MENHENGFVDQIKENKYVDIMCMFDDITYIDYLPKYDQYDDDYVVEIEARPFLPRHPNQPFSTWMGVS